MPLPFDTLAAHPDHWLVVRCACERRAYLPTKMLARQHGAETRLQDIVARLRCQQCGARPIEAELRDDVQTSASGYARGYPGGRA
jgi:cytochrome c-type biogenesis protein CcmH/NrfF